MKKIINKVILAITVMILGCITVCGAELESVQKNMVLETTEEVELRVEPSATAKTIATLQVGTAVVVAEDANGDWCKVAYKEQEGYVSVTKLKALGNTEELNSEFDKISQTVQLAFEEIMTREHEEMQARIWGSIIVVLIVAIFGVGIASAVKKNKEEAKKEILETKGEDTNEVDYSDSVL